MEIGLTLVQWFQLRWNCLGAASDAYVHTITRHRAHGINSPDGQEQYRVSVEEQEIGEGGSN